MQKISFLLVIGLLMASAGSFAQVKAHIHIRKDQNGVKSEETREVQLNEGQNIQEILLEMGILDEFGQLKTGQELEIRIDKTEGLDQLNNLDILMAPEDLESWGLPEFAQAPLTENKPFLGVMLREKKELNAAGSGVVISEVVEASAAAQAGLKPGDIITRIDDKKIERIDDVINYVQSKEKGEKIEVHVLRDQKKKKFKAVLGEKAMEPRMSIHAPTEPDMPRYNLRFGPDSITIYCPSSPNCILPNDSMKICQPFSWNGDGMAIRETAFLGVTPMEPASEEGVRINVEEETSAEKMQLLDGDIIIEVNGVPVSSFDALALEIGKTNPGDEIKLLIERDGKRKEISGEIGKRSISGFDDFRIFHDFKGMDEGGNYFYDYEFDMDEEDVQQRMEELLLELDNQHDRIEEERNRIESELDRLNKNRDSVVIKIQIAEITAEETEKVNSKASPKLELSNDLALEQISFFPNPNDGILNLNFITTEKSPIKIVLYTAEGEMVYLEERASFSGNYSNTINISDEPNGTYFLQILQNGKTFSKKIIKGM